MDERDRLVQVSVCLPKSHMLVLPELMRAMTTACCSSYSWDSIKLSVDGGFSPDGSRLVLNLGKNLSSEAEVVRGKLHTCRESICRHDRAVSDLVGDVRMTTYAARSLKEYLKDQEKSDLEEYEETGQVNKKVSDEMFFPSWYDNLRLKSVSQLGEGLFQSEMVESRPLPVPPLQIDRLRVEPFYRSESEEYFPLKTDEIPFTKTVEEISDETFRLKKVCDRAKTFTQSQGVKREDRTPTPPSDVQLTIRQLKERLDAPVPSQPDIYPDEYPVDHNNSRHADYAFRQFLSYDEHMPSFPLCETDESLNVHDDIVVENHRLLNNFMESAQDFVCSAEIVDTKENYDSQDELIVVMPPSIKKTMFHRSYSANVVSRQYEDGSRRELGSSKKKRGEKKRPKSGPAKRVDFVGPTQRDRLSQGDSLLISEFVPHPSSECLLVRTVSENRPVSPPLVLREKKKKSKPKERTNPLEVVSDKPIVKDHDKRAKDKKHKDPEADDIPTLYITYKPSEEPTQSDSLKPKVKHRREGNEIGPVIKHKKPERKKIDDKASDEKFTFYPLEKQDDKREKRNRGKGDEKKPSKRPRSEKSDKTPTSEAKPASSKPSKSPTRQDPVKEKLNADKKRGFLGKRSPGTTLKEHDQLSDHKTGSKIVGKGNEKRNMSFLELISVMTEEVKQFGKKKHHNKLKDKIT